MRVQTLQDALEWPEFVVDRVEEQMGASGSQQLLAALQTFDVSTAFSGVDAPCSVGPTHEVAVVVVMISQLLILGVFIVTFRLLS